MVFDFRRLWKITAVTLLFLLTSCGLGAAPKGRKPSPDWSRGVPLNVSVAGTAGMAVSDDGNRVHVTWPTVVEDELVIHYMQIDESLTPIVDRNLDLPEGRARTPRLLLDENGNVQLVWARRPGGGVWELWQAVVNGEGEVVETGQVSTAEMNVSDYAIAQAPAGTGFVVWEDAKTNKIWGARLGETADPTLLVEAGIAPSIQVDQQNTMHMSWFNNNTIYYTAFANGQLATTIGTRLVDIELSPTDTLGGPELALTEDTGYIAWSRYIASGLESNTGRTDYVAFALDNPAPLAAPDRLSITTDEEQPYEPYEGAYALTVLAPPPPIISMGGNYTIQPDAAIGRGQEVAVVVSAEQDIRLNNFVQMAVAIFKDGEFVGYEVAAKTEGLSQEGTLATDGDGNLHLIWREGAGGRRLYYATTSPALRESLDALTSEDWLTAVFAGVFEGATGLAFFPLAMLWLLPGGLILGIRQLRVEDETVSTLSAYFLLGISLILYQLTKLLVLPTVLTYVPFSAWIEIPVRWEVPLRIIYPILSMVISIAVAEWFRRKRPATSTLLYFFIVCLVDVIFTLSVYGVAFLGNF